MNKDLTSTKLIYSVASLLNEKGVSIATAESCTGGLLSHVLTSISGSSSYFDRGVISYSNQAKTELLGIEDKLIKHFGAVSKEVAFEMAKGIRKNAQTDIGVSTTGIAGPTGGSEEKPVGLVFIGISTEKQTNVKRFNFHGNRLENKDATCTEALTLIKEVIKREFI